MYQRTNSAAPGPSWLDVKARMQHLMKLYGWAIVVEMTDPPEGAFRPTRGIWWRVVARRRVGDEGLYSERGCGHLWPTPKFRTVPELLLACLNDLDRVLKDMEVDQAVGTPLRLHFCPPKVTPTDLS